MDFQKVGKILNSDVAELLKKITLKKKKPANGKNRGPVKASLVVSLILLIFILGFFEGIFLSDRFAQETKTFFSALKTRLPFLGGETEVHESPPLLPSPNAPVNYVPQTSQEEAVIKVVKEFSPAVVSVIISKDMPVYEEYYENLFDENLPFQIEVPRYRQKGTERKTVGGGTGFIISEDGMILTNKHVVSDPDAFFTVLTNEGERFPTSVLALDPFQDLAVLKIDTEKIISEQGKLLEQTFKTVKLGDSSNLQIGQTVITIGNALGEFRNTVSVGVISGLGRTVTASGGGIIETLEGVIQTDAAINKGNSGGPLLNLRGEVIGVNVAMAEAAQNIGFSIPINQAKEDIEQIKTIGKIVYAFLGVRYVLITPEIQQEKNLSVDYGALIVKGESDDEPAVVADSAADKAGLREDDIILEIDGKKINQENSLSSLIRNRQPGDKIVLKILRNGKEIIREAILGEKTS